MATSKRASQRRAVAMSEEEVEAYLASQMKVQVASIGRDGMPHLTTLFYVVHEGRIGFWTYATSQKVKNLERDPRVSVLVESGSDYFELTGVSIQGTAEIVRDHDRIREIGSRVAAAMAGVTDIAELGELGQDTVEKQVLKRVAILVTPDKVASWDHSKMNILPGGGGQQ
ncbi:pyridoxamine 5'-phosphate oxidase family protein [Nocardioides caldifontis]|uniref:pyridoxamine 5'-phosphate oxidase family protein n=1 Tax=Nocardioides caldifontis TaxID=2588938 RepID=UPI0019398629|nr:pyridoxamine 5'-phosphate oxidase family protein [Nocardioides caldifontis]